MYCYYKCSVALPRVPQVGLQCVIVVFPNHTHLPFYAALYQFCTVFIDNKDIQRQKYINSGL